MADLKRRLPGNVAGEFYVDATCIDCDQCRRVAPATFRARRDTSVVYRQPGTPGEARRAEMALVTCPTGSIGTRGQRDLSEAIAAYPEPRVRASTSADRRAHADPPGRRSPRHPHARPYQGAPGLALRGRGALHGRPPRLVAGNRDANRLPRCLLVLVARADALDGGLACASLRVGAARPRARASGLRGRDAHAPGALYWLDEGCDGARLRLTRLTGAAGTRMVLFHPADTHLPRAVQTEDLR